MAAKEIKKSPAKKSQKQGKRRVVKNSYSDKKKTVNKSVSKKSSKKPLPSRTKKPAVKRTAAKKTVRLPKDIKITFLGGLNEIGKNITVYEYAGEMLVVDCGLAFPDTSLLGVDAVIPDFTYLKENASKIKAIIITHGHEDHIGGLPYLMEEINAPIYGTALTVGLIEYKLKEHALFDKCTLKTFNAGDVLKIGKFEVECIHVNHSIPDAVAFAIKTGAGTIVQTGDFKIDNTPIDSDIINLPRFAELGSQGVLALLQDSTNAEKEGYTLSESLVGKTFDELFREAGKKRIIVATFASNVHRIQQILNVAKALKRKVAVMGRSMENIVKLGEELGYLKVSKGLLITQNEIKNYPDSKLVLICTGSQGEPMAALSKMALSEHRQVEIGANDYVIISSRPIPGNEKGVGNVINALMQHGADVIYENMYQTHVSGHACAEELKMMINLVKPKLFIPVHGEQKHLKKHAELAMSMGYKEKNILISENGESVSISSKGEVRKKEKVEAGQIFIDGSGVGDVGSVVLRDRNKLSSAGMVAVSAAIDNQSRYLLAGPEVISRGFVYVKENEKLMETLAKKSEDDIQRYLNSKNYDLNILRTKIRDDISQLIYRETKRNPMILVIIMEV